MGLRHAKARVVVARIAVACIGGQQLSDEKTPAPSGFKFEIAKEIDKALADVLRGLFERPAQAVGDLASDAIGIFGDRIKRKREINAQIGIEEVRKKLEAANVEMKDITPPAEEELHLLVTGLSLTVDANLRDLWAGLFANALDPSSPVKAERPFLSVLQSLSPTDAKVIEFLTFISRTEAELRRSAKTFRPANISRISAEEESTMKGIMKVNLECQRAAIKSIEDKAKEYGFDNPPDSSWAENLFRQGVVERTPLQQPLISPPQIQRTNERTILEMANYLEKKIGVMDESAKRKASPPQKFFSRGGFGPQLNLEIQLSSFGRRFSEACGLL